MGVSLCEFESRPPHQFTAEEKSKGFSSFSFIQPAVNLSEIPADRIIVKVEKIFSGVLRISEMFVPLQYRSSGLYSNPLD